MANMVEVSPREAKGEIHSSMIDARCRHYWIIETPNGSSSQGVCKFCKEEREFHNSAERYVLKRRHSVEPKAA